MADAKRPLLNSPERELPMPRYEYQTPRPGSFAVSYDGKKESARGLNRDAPCGRTQPDRVRNAEVQVPS